MTGYAGLFQDAGFWNGSLEFRRKRGPGRLFFKE
jgi:hypothetical protein